MCGGSVGGQLDRFYDKLRDLCLQKARGISEDYDGIIGYSQRARLLIIMRGGKKIEIKRPCRKAIKTRAPNKMIY